MKRLIVLPILVLLVGAGWRLTDHPAKKPAAAPAPTLIDVRHEAVRRIVVESHGHQSVLVQQGEGIWTAEGATPDEAAGLMLEFADKLFPLRGYRELTADAATADYGLADPEIVLRVEGGQGTRSVALGGASFTGGGNYAKVDGDGEHVYLVPRGAMDQLRSLALGHRVEAPPSTQEQQVAKEFADEASASQTPAGDAPPPEDTPWLRQAMEGKP